MGTHVIRMPDIGEGIAEVELVEWHVAVGDSVREDQTLADVMTDKATVEIPSPVTGVVVALGGKVGEVLAVGSELVRLEVEGEGNVATAEAARQRAAGPAAADAVAPPAAAVAAPPEPIAPTAPAPTPAPASLIARSALPVAGRPSRAPGDKPIASPAVRRRAWDLGVDLRLVAGSGPAGRILQSDLDAYVAGGVAPVAAPSRYAPREGATVVPVIGLRRRIAQRMQESKRRIPHFTYVEEVDVSELETLRARLNELHGVTRGRLTVLPFLMRAIVLAAPSFRDLNAHYDDEAGTLTRHAPVHVGIATQTPAGLMVPVVRHAEARDLWSCAAEIARLAAAARAGEATRDELTGSTITITSLGPLGGIVTTPVINPPETAIVGVNRIVTRPVWREGAVVPRQIMNLSSSFDHRVVDGLVAAEFVQALRRALECPALLFVE